VAVLLLPIDKGILTIRRGEAPDTGKLALPGGYIDLNETWQQACVRELREETNIEVPAEEVALFRVHTSMAGYVLVFGLALQRKERDLPEFIPNPEVLERVIIHAPEPLAFGSHTKAIEEFFALNPPKKTTRKKK
jgi:ADP-ribose pyrophosphatase YjhB (NUDIX family)